MKQNKFSDLLMLDMKLLGINLKSEQIHKFYNYMKLLREWNEKINLTAITEPEEIIKKHFVDSVTISKYIKNNDNIIDVGTGAGFPGIPLKIINDSLNITLLDSLNKRLTFLNEIISKLNLKRIVTQHARAEEAGVNKMYREQYDIAVSRAVAQLNILAEYLLPFVKIGGHVICMKANCIEEELKSAQNAIRLLGGEIENKEEFVLPNTDISRTIILIKKVKSTPGRYPRKSGIPTKQPIS